MGNGQSAAAYVVLDRHVYAQGDPISGSVVFNTPKHVPFHSVNLTVIGKEKTHWEVRRSSGKTSHTDHYNGKADVIKAVLPLMQGPGTLNPGGHRFPFSFSLPDGLPPSFEYKCGSTRASIAYKVKVMVDQVGMLAKDFKASAEFLLLPPPPRAPAPLRAEAEAPVTGCCCRGRGSAALQVDGPADVVAAGQAVGVSVKVDNCSTEPLACEAAVTRSVRLKAQGVFGDDAHSAELVAARRPLGVPGAGGLKGGKAGVAAGAVMGFREDLLVPEGEMASLVGGTQLIQVWHELRVLAQPPACCASAVRAARPVVVFEPLPLLQRRAAVAAAAATAHGTRAPPAPPAGWAPAEHAARAWAIANRQGAPAHVRPDQLAQAAAGADKPGAGPYDAGGCEGGGAGGIAAHWGPPLLVAAGGAAPAAPWGAAAAGGAPPAAPWGAAAAGGAPPAAPRGAAAAGEVAYPPIGGAAPGGGGEDAAYPTIGPAAGSGCEALLPPPPAAQQPGW